MIYCLPSSSPRFSLKLNHDQFQCYKIDFLHCSLSGCFYTIYYAPLINFFYLLTHDNSIFLFYLLLFSILPFTSSSSNVSLYFSIFGMSHLNHLPIILFDSCQFGRSPIEQQQFIKIFIVLNAILYNFFQKMYC